MNRALIIIPLCLLMSGCVWFRMLRTKGQLKDFDTNFSFETSSQQKKKEESSGFTLLFKKPLLKGNDIHHLN